MLDKNILKKFEMCIDKNESFFNTYFKDNDKNKTMVIVSKLPYSKFEVKIKSNKWSNRILDFYNSLNAYDCWNLINEYLS